MSDFVIQAAAVAFVAGTGSLVFVTMTAAAVAVVVAAAVVAAAAAAAAEAMMLGTVAIG